MTSLTKSASGTDGVTITTGNSGLDVVTIGSNATAVYASNEWKFSTGASSVQCFAGLTTQVTALWPSGMTTHYGSFYVTADSLPAGTRIIYKLTDAGVTADRVTFVMLSTGAIRMRNAAAGTVATFAVACSAGTRYRVDYRDDGSGTGAWEMHLFAGDSTTPLDSQVGGTANFGGAIGAVFFGWQTSSASSPGIRVDHVTINDTGLPGPFITATTASGSTATGGSAVAVGVTTADGSTATGGSASSSAGSTTSGSTTTSGSAASAGGTSAGGSSGTDGQGLSGAGTTSDGSTITSGQSDGAGNTTASGTSTTGGVTASAASTVVVGVTLSELTGMAVAAATTVLGTTVSSGSAQVPAEAVHAAEHSVSNTSPTALVTAAIAPGTVERTAP